MPAEWDVRRAGRSVVKEHVIVTGGAGGIGSVISEKFIEGGYRVVAVDTDAARKAHK